MANEVTLEQLLRTTSIRRLVNRIKTPIGVLQRFYNLQVGGSASESARGREIGWDIFDSTRTLAAARAPGVGPGTVQPKPIGHVSATAVRLHEKIPLLWERIFRTRRLGAQVGTVDARGQAYVAAQTRYGVQRFRNAREFMVSRMFLGGFGIELDGENHYLVDTGSGDITVDFQIPAANKTQLDMGTGSNIIDASWATASTDILGHLYEINAAFERLHGYPLRHVWCDSTIIQHVFNNTGIINSGGTAFRVFDRLDPRENVRSDEGIPDTGFEIVLRGVPWLTWHVYDAVLSLSQTSPDSTTAANTTKVIPANKAIFTPEPGEWCGYVEGSEMIQERHNTAPREAIGFDNWTTPTLDPAGFELKMIDNGLPALYVPNAVAVGTVVF